MKYLSVCSGIEAASVAWEPLGWEPLAFSEIEPFPRAVLEHHYPHVPCHGDFTVLRHEPWIADADVLVGGTPCQAFSVAGLRKSLGDDRGNLSLEFIRLADSIDAAREAQGRDPAIIVWENVPGVLSVRDNAFGCFLSGLSGEDTPFVPPRGKWTNAGVALGPARAVAWRILDAQFFGLPQRRRRVFVVASAREGFDPAAVLLEFEGVRRDTPPRREAGQDPAGTIEASLGRSRGAGTPPGALSHWDGVDHPHPTLNQSAKSSGGVGASNQELFSQRGAYLVEQPYTVANCLTARMHKDINSTLDEGQTPVVTHGYPDPAYAITAGAQGKGGVFGSGRDGQDTFVTHSLRAEGFDASEDGTGRGNDASQDLSPTLRALGAYDANGGGQMAVAIPVQEVGKRTGTSTTDPRAGIGIGEDGDPMFTLQAGAQHGVAAYAFQPRIARNGRGDMGDLVNALNAQSGETGKGDTAPCVAVGFGGDVARTLSARHDSSPCVDRGMDVVAAHMAVRRLTPIECERLQGFPDDYTLIPWKKKPADQCPDGPRYKALGNSMAVPCMRWIGRRIAEALK